MSDYDDDRGGLDPDQFDRLVEAMREADKAHQTSGGGTRHYLRECLLPALDRYGLRVEGTR